MDGIPILQTIRFIFVPAYIFGLGYLVSRFLLKRGDFALSVFLSLSIWSIVGWFSFGYLEYITWILTIAGFLGLFIGFKDLISDRENILGFLVVILLRFLTVAPLTFPYGNDTIMHSYTTYTIVKHGGFFPNFEPFGFGGMGSFNLGFHYISATLSYITGLSAMNSVILAGYIFWGAYFLAVNTFLKDWKISLIITFIVLGPSTFMAWGGFPTLASLSFSLYAFYFNGTISLPFWIGSFSTHFIPSSVAFLSYILSMRKDINRTFLFGLLIVALILLPQYYTMLNQNFSLEPYENSILNAFVKNSFVKPLMFNIVYVLLAFLGYKKFEGLREKVPPLVIFLPIIFGVLSYIWAVFDLKPHHIKSFYMGRLFVPLIIPAFFGLKWIIQRFKFLYIPLFIVGLSLVFNGHTKYKKDADIWSYVSTFKPDTLWAYVKYGTEESFLPAFGVPAYYSHYIITQLYDVREFALKRKFGYIFLRYEERNEKVLDVVKRYGILIRDFGKLKVYKLKEPVMGKYLIQ